MLRVFVSRFPSTPAVYLPAIKNIYQDDKNITVDGFCCPPQNLSPDKGIPAFNSMSDWFDVGQV
jgi:hypothetical protein